MIAAEEIERILRTVEPAICVVSRRNLLRVLLYLRDHGHAVPSNTALAVWVGREDLLAADVPRVTLPENGGSSILLIPEVVPFERGGGSRSEELRLYWQLIFRGKVWQALERKSASDPVAKELGADGLARFGPVASREIRYVLESDNLADPAADDAILYRTFAAVYLNAHFFTPSAIAAIFPSVPEPAMVLAVFDRDLDVAALLAQSRPAGAASPQTDPAIETVSTDADETTTSNVEPRGLLDRAEKAESKGNLVRAAILGQQAARNGSGEEGKLAAERAQASLGRLVEKLGLVRGWNEAARREWRDALAPLLVSASCGIWPRAARCLYELQKVPADLAGEVYAIDLVEHIRTLGRRPIKRLLPHARHVALLGRLRAAHRQLIRSGLASTEMLPLDKSFGREIRAVEGEVRRSLAPVVASALEEGGFLPGSQVEEVARDKVVAELLDGVCERGYLRMGDLRDAIARNQLKMPDLDGIGEFVLGDPLLRTDTRMASAIDGVYRRGECYLRWLQRASSISFGTKAGRMISLYAIAPFLAAFLALMAMEEFRHIGGKVVAFGAKVLAPRHAPALPTPPAPKADSAQPPDETDFGWDEPTEDLIWFDPVAAKSLAREVATSSAAASTAHRGSVLTDWPTIIGLGTFLLLIFHVPPFRRGVVGVLGQAWSFLRLGLWDVPNAIFQSTAVRAIRYSWIARFIDRRLAAAILTAACTVLFLWLLGAGPGRLIRWGSVAFALAAAVFNTPRGAVLQDRIGDRFARAWRSLRVNFLLGFVAIILHAFARLANWVERQLYAIDEWFRYRRGDSQGSVALKAVLGLVWFPIAYLARFAFYLLIEPQINPVKHFPVVTVSHKVILPMTPSVAGSLGISEAAAAGLLGCIPGIFGFMAWELMANWKLYRVNRPVGLEPIAIGHHGETMRGILRPGFHSGTVPKLFRKLRRAMLVGDSSAAARARHELDGVAEAVRRFVDRELVAILGADGDWHGQAIEVGAVRFGCQRVVVELVVPSLGWNAIAFGFENRGGRVEAAVEAGAILDKLRAPQRAAFLNAVRGLMDMAAADLFDDRDRVAEEVYGIEMGKGCPYPELIRRYSFGDWVTTWGPAIRMKKTSMVAH